MASSWRATYLSYAATSRVICSSFRHVIHVYRSAMFFTYNTSLKAWHTCHRTSMILFHLASLFYKIFERWKVTKRFHNLRGGTQKFPELLKEIYLKYLYKFETLVPFEVSPPRDWMQQSQHRSQWFQHWERCLGLLHPVAGGIFWKGLQFQTCTNTLHTSV